MSKTRLEWTRDQGLDDAEVCRILEQLRRTPEIFATISASCDDELALQSRLRQTYPPEIVRSAIQLDELRQRAASKFSRAAEMWFDRVGLEQATSEPVARHKAARFSGEVDDLCCGIGGDALALASHCDVRAIDRKSWLTLMATWNAEAFGVASRLTSVVGDCTQLVNTERLVHLDPDRRTGARRSTRIEDYVPSLNFMNELIDSAPGGSIKLSPASNFGGKFPGCEIELVSLHGECKEAIVWFGSLASDVSWRATLLPQATTIAGEPLSAEAEVSPVQQYIYDPDPALVRSGLLDVAACELDLCRLDDAEEYLTSQQLVNSDFVTPFAVVAELPHSKKQIRRYFREQPFGSVEIKSRHLKVDVDKFRRKLTLTGEGPITLIFARVGGRSRALVCRRLGTPT